MHVLFYENVTYTSWLLSFTTYCKILRNIFRYIGDQNNLMSCPFNILVN